MTAEHDADQETRHEPAEPSLVLDLPGGPLGLIIRGDDGAEDDALATELRRLWSHLLLEETIGAEIETVTISANPLPPADGVDAQTRHREAVERATYVVSGRVTRALLARLVGTRILLHAGTVHREDTGTVVLIGPSGAGKSTATSLLAQGGLYLTDELTMLDTETFTVTGYPKPVSRAGDAGYKRDLHLGDSGLIPARDAAAPSHIVLLSRDADREAPPELTRAPLGHAIVRITEQSSSLWRLEKPLETLARLLDSVGGALEASYRESDDLLRLLSDPPAPVSDGWAVIDPVTEADSSATEQAGDAGELIRTAPFRQGLVAEDGTVVLRDHSVVHLTGITARVWELVADRGEITRESIAGALIEAMGEHPDAERFTDQALTQLRDDGMISWS